MHEASLAQGLLRVTLESVSAYNQEHPETRALRAEGTPAEGARLDIEREPLPCMCSSCNTHFELVHRKFVCPHCGSQNISFTGGHGLTLLGLEVENNTNSSNT